MAHWREWQEREHLSHADLIDPNTGRYREYTLKIVGVRKGHLKSVGGKQKRWFLKFEKARKEFASNATCNKVLEALAGSPDPKRWVGLVVTLYVTKTDSPEGVVDCIRIKNTKAPASAATDAIPDDEPAIDAAAAAPVDERAALEASSTRTGQPPQLAPPPNCLACDKPFAVGEDVVFADHKHPEKGARHPGCVKPAAAPAAKAAPPPASTKPVDPGQWTPEPPPDDED